MKKLLMVLLLINVAIASEWKDGYSPMNKDGWNKLGITDKAEAIKWRKLKMYISYPEEYSIVKELLTAGISSDKCISTIKTIYQSTGQRYRKKSCKDDYKKVIDYVKNGSDKIIVNKVKNKTKVDSLNSYQKMMAKASVSTPNLTITKIKEIVREKKKSPEEQELIVWSSVNINNIEEINQWKNLGFKMGRTLHSSNTKYYGTKLSKLTQVGLKPNSYKEWTKLNNSSYTDNENINQIVALVNHNISVGEANKWIANNIKLYNIVEWKNAGVKTPNQATILSQNKVKISDVKIANENNIGADEVMTWKQAGLKVKNISKWKDSGINTPKEALSWQKIGIEYNTAKRLKKSGYNSVKAFNKVCKSYLHISEFIYKTDTPINGSCFVGKFKISKILSDNKVYAISIVKAYQTTKIGQKSPNITANDKLNNDFKRGATITGVFKIDNGVFSSEDNLIRISY
jgi:hypothetical protein